MANVTKAELHSAIKALEARLNKRIGAVAKMQGAPGPEGKQGPPGKDAAPEVVVDLPPEGEPAPDLFHGSGPLAYEALSNREAQIQPKHTVSWVQAPDGSGDNVAKISVSNIDGTEQDPEGVKITSNPRGELKSPAFPNDQEVWWAFCYWLPPDFLASIDGWWNIIDGWWNIAEGPYGPGWNGSPPFEIDLRDNGVGWTTNSYFPGGGFKDIWRVPYVRGVKHSVLVHNRAETPAGVSSTGIEVWHDSILRAAVAFPTIDPSNSPGPQHYILQNYRKRDMYMGTATIYYWPLKIGTTREAVEYV